MLQYQCQPFAGATMLAAKEIIGFHKRLNCIKMPKRTFCHSVVGDTSMVWTPVVRVSQREAQPVGHMSPTHTPATSPSWAPGEGGWPSGLSPSLPNFLLTSALGVKFKCHIQGLGENTAAMLCPSRGLPEACHSNILHRLPSSYGGVNGGLRGGVHASGWEQPCTTT